VKDLCGIPWRLALALQADGWWLRSDIIWAKPNPMPESVTDRPTTSHEHVFMLTKAARYFYDAEAVREPQTGNTHSMGKKLDPPYESAGIGHKGWAKTMLNIEVPGGRNLRSVWNIATQPFPEAHFATFPEKLVQRCIMAGTSERGACPECGAPWERVVEKVDTGEKQKMPDGFDSKPGAHGTIHREGREKGESDKPVLANKILGWRPTCECGGEPVPCVVLDPFLGSGTTIKVAHDLGRDGIGIELNPDYCDMAEKRTMHRQESLGLA
jgi:DNA modification methylase